MGKRVVIALGGNAILRPNQEATYENQLKNVQISSDLIANVKKAGHKVIVTHGNGPQLAIFYVKMKKQKLLFQLYQSMFAVLNPKALSGT